MKRTPLLAAAAALLAGCAHTPWQSTPSAATIAAGRQIAFAKNKGNCLACHMMPTDPRAVTSANIGPPLLHMKVLFPDRKKLFDQIWDATRDDPDSVMPPFGRNKILTRAEIRKLIDYLYTL